MLLTTACVYLCVLVCSWLVQRCVHWHTYGFIFLLMRAASWEAEGRHITFNFILTLLLMKNINYKLKWRINWLGFHLAALWSAEMRGRISQNAQKNIKAEFKTAVNVKAGLEEWVLEWEWCETTSGLVGGELLHYLNPLRWFPLHLHHWEPPLMVRCVCVWEWVSEREKCWHILVKILK